MKQNNRELALKMIEQAYQLLGEEEKPKRKKKPEPVERKPHPLATVFKIALIIGALAFFANAMS